ncbi:inositol monophosphatase family protein [Nocardioides ferulae]|uniref:inositol monophosphatase family protein n=1 Tax=Nocardioides ferulae TaxID=2340821 RepID=UPI001F0C3FE6|nr:inositol monophosphatase [Nocardioides ferulae]
MTGVAAARIDPDDELLAAALVREAGTLARRMRAAGVEVGRKTSVSDVVTEADHAAEALVVDRLRRERPDDGLVGEEGAAHRGSSGREWFVDPVDGTWNFVHGVPWWCSAVALRDADDLMLGAVHDPHAQTTYLGGPGLASTRDGVPLAPLVDRPLAETGVVTYLHPPLYAGPIGEAFGRAVAGAATLRMLGSMSMDCVAIAEGRFGALLAHSVKPWDEFPGAAIIRGVGGVTRHLTAAGVDWYAAGAPTAVDELCASLVAQA